MTISGGRFKNGAGALRKSVRVASLMGISTIFLLRGAHADELSDLPLAPASKPAISSFGITTKSGHRTEAVPDKDAPGVESPPSGRVAPFIVRIQGGVPPYVDRHVAMVPLRPLLSFLRAAATYRDGQIEIVQPPAPELSALGLSINLRVDSNKAQVSNDKVRRDVLLPVNVEQRLGTVFVPLRFLAQALGAVVDQSPEGAGALVRFQGRIGIIDPVAQEGYRGIGATRVIIANRMGKSMSLRLSGPQTIAVELGPGQSVTRSMRPGVYNYRAASSGMKLVSGVRRLLPNKKATWAWQRR